MKRSSLLVRMVISIFLVFLILLALVGTFYYQSSSSAIEATIEGNSQTTISQTSHFIHSYIKKLETTSTSLTQQADVLAYAENPNQDKVKGISRSIFDHFEGRPGLESCCTGNQIWSGHFYG